MKKLLLLFLLIPTISFADWFLLGTNTDNNDIFLNTEGLKKEANKVTVWTKINYKDSSPPNEVKSTRTLDEYDCNKRTQTTLSLMGFSELDFAGEIVIRMDNIKERVYIAPDTMSDFVLKFVCSM
jgi:hypothetical protein